MFRLTKIVVMILFLFGIIFCVSECKVFAQEKKNTAALSLLEKIVDSRAAFYRAYMRPNEMLKMYEKDNYVLEVTNPSKKDIRIDDVGIFFDFDRIKEEMQISDDDTEKVKARKVYNFVKDKRVHAYGLYKDETMRNAPRFFSVYGAGLCHDAACNMAYLAHKVGLNARTWWLHGHVVADVTYDGKGHIFDPDALGIVEYEGDIADINGMVALAKEGKLGDYNEVYSTTKDNIPGIDTRYLSYEVDNPYLEFLPGEKKMFYEHVFMLTTDWDSFKGNPPARNKFYDEYEGNIGNFVREIPINKITAPDGSIVVGDYFPMVGAYITVPKKNIKGKFKSGDVRVLVDSEIFKQKIFMPVLVQNSSGYKNVYIDLSLGVKNLERLPSYSVQVKGLGEVMDRYKDVKLVTVHYYSYANAKFDEEVLIELNKRGIKTHKPEGKTQ